jgi:hypothetical protein
VLREFDQPDLARAYAEHGSKRDRQALPAPRSLAAVLAAAARTYTLQNVFTRDLASAQQAGLLTLTGLETPAELAGCVLGPPLLLTGDLVADLEQTRRFAGQVVALDGLEHLAAATISPGDLVSVVARGLRLTGLQGVLNLNVELVPSWADSLASGPLFAGHHRPNANHLHRQADHLLEQFLNAASPALRIDWHLGARDFLESGRNRLLRTIRYALEGASIGFVFDRPRRPIALAEGLDRQHPATLLVAGLHLPALARQPGMLADAERFRQRLGSLVRLALSAAVQKRAFVRQKATADVTSGFLLGRARFVVVPVGLDEVVHQFTGWSMTSGGPSLELGRQIVRRLAEVLRQDGQLSHMDACLAGPFTFSVMEGIPAERDAVAGLTPWDARAGLRGQLRTGGALHTVAENGTLALFVDNESPEELAEALAMAWQQPGLLRLRLLRRPREQGQLFPP